MEHRPWLSIFLLNELNGISLSKHLVQEREIFGKEHQSQVLPKDFLIQKHVLSPFDMRIILLKRKAVTLENEIVSGKLFFIYTWEPSGKEGLLAE